MLLGSGGVGAYFLFGADASEDGPVVDASHDLRDAPMGCGLFTEAEITPSIPGRFTTEPTAIVGGNKDYENSAQCMYSNQGIATGSLPVAFLSVTTRLHKADARESGVDKANDALHSKTG
ncbi:hypothetical protein [Nocardia sp. NBC_00416]|uniref:hypothetical protein n=1 Tax=Nocardia sp. NBC_00416 TaxID=2975991 RepID=UPI002E247AA2